MITSELSRIRAREYCRVYEMQLHRDTEAGRRRAMLVAHRAADAFIERYIAQASAATAAGRTIADLEDTIRRLAGDLAYLRAIVEEGRT